MPYRLRLSSDFWGRLLLGLSVALSLLLPSARVSAQALGHAADSLRRVLRQHPADTSGVRALTQLAELLVSANPDSGVYYARRALAAARPYPALAAAAALRLGTAYYYQHNLAEAQRAYDSAYQIAQAQGNARQMGEAQRRNGNVALERADYSQALAYYQRAAQVHEQAGQAVEAGMARGNMGYLYKQIGDYDKALITFFQELRTMERVTQTPGLPASDYQKANAALCYTLSYIGETYNRTKNWAQARTYLTRLLARYRQQQDQEGIANTLSNLAVTSVASGQLAAAEQLFRQALSIQQARHDPVATGVALSNLAEILARRHNYAEAAHQYELAVATYQRVRNLRQMYQPLVGLASARLALHQPAAAATALDSARRYIRLLHSKQAYATFYEIERDYYEQVGQPQQALRSFRQHALYKDSLLNADKAQVLADLSVRYETEKKEVENRLQAARLRTQQQVIRRRNMQLLAGLAVVTLLAVVAWLLYNRRRLRQQLEFEVERQRLVRQRAAAVLEAEENERRRIGSDLHDGIGQLLTAAKLNLHALDQQLGARPAPQQVLIDNALAVVDESFREVRGISHNLLPNALLKRGLAAAVRDFLHKLPAGNGLRVEVEAFGLDEARLDPTVESVLFRVIQELVQNIVKHAHASQISLQLVRNDHELTIMVEDNGVGFDPATLGPDAGIGLRNIETRMAYLGGHAHFDAAPGHGTTVTLEVPVEEGVKG